MLPFSFMEENSITACELALLSVSQWMGERFSMCGTGAKWSIGELNSCEFKTITFFLWNSFLMQAICGHAEGISTCHKLLIGTIAKSAAGIGPAIHTSELSSSQSQLSRLCTRIHSTNCRESAAEQMLATGDSPAIHNPSNSPLLSNGRTKGAEDGKVGRVCLSYSN